MPADPSREPALARAMPADAGKGPVAFTDAQVEIKLADRTWTGATVRARRHDMHGRWCVLLAWYSSPSVGGREDWFIYDPALIRPVAE